MSLNEAFKIRGTDPDDTVDQVEILDRADLVVEVDVGEPESLPQSALLSDVPESELDNLVDAYLAEERLDTARPAGDEEGIFVPVTIPLPPRLPQGMEGMSLPQTEARGNMKESGVRAKHLTPKREGFEIPPVWNAGRRQEKETTPPPVGIRDGYPQSYLHLVARQQLEGALDGLELLVDQAKSSQVEPVRSHEGISKARMSLKLLLRDPSFNK